MFKAVPRLLLRQGSFPGSRKQWPYAFLGLPLDLHSNSGIYTTVYIDLQVKDIHSPQDDCTHLPLHLGPAGIVIAASRMQQHNVVYALWP